MIKTWSKFTYGFSIDTSNNSLNIDEGGGELLVTVSAGSYTLGEFVGAVKAALNDVGTNEYEVVVDRVTGLVTISADNDFDILLSSGTQIGVSFADLLGFVQVTDLTGTDTYTGASRAGLEYYPQFLLQSYVPPENYKQSSDATINKTASGRVEVVRFGIERLIEMDVKFITSLPMDGKVIKNNPRGLEAALEFLSDVSQKTRFEFVPDVDEPDEFYKVILESFPGFQNGTGFKLKELYAQNLPDIYETGVFTLRVL